MCLIVPGKIKKVGKGGCLVNYNSKEVEIKNSLVRGIEVGDWVVVQNKFIIDKLDKNEVTMFFEALGLNKEVAK